MTKPKWHKFAGHNKVSIDLDRLRTEYLARRPVKEIASEYDVTVQTVYSRLKRLGITRTNSESHIGLPAHYKANGFIDQLGYRVITVNGKQIREHRHVMQRHLGRKLRPGEVVHHINHNRADNRPENLELHSSHSQHMQEHMNTKEARDRGRKGLETMKAQSRHCLIPGCSSLCRKTNKHGLCRKHRDIQRRNSSRLAALKAVNAL